MVDVGGGREGCTAAGGWDLRGKVSGGREERVWREGMACGKREWRVLRMLRFVLALPFRRVLQRAMRLRRA